MPLSRPRAPVRLLVRVLLVGAALLAGGAVIIGPTLGPAVAATSAAPVPVVLVGATGL
ncbi:MAG: hypothetical protein H0V48_04770, partial [Nocardioidaceae bacterium]|nr:hypothetical protein [Nocardioidaceae bacterium]